jgi:hypothetical protein
MKRAARAIALAALLTALLAPAAQAAEFGLHGFDVRFAGQGGEAQMQAGSHPFAMETSFAVDVDPATQLPAGAVKDLRLAQVPGFAGIPSATPRCKDADFLKAPLTGNNAAPECSDGTAVGLTAVEIGQITREGPSTETQFAPVYNLEPPPGVAAKLGFYILGVPIVVNVGVSEDPPYNVIASVSGISQVLEFLGSTFTIWGVPASPAHDALRGHCLAATGASLGSCPAGVSEVPFLIAPAPATARSSRRSKPTPGPRPPSPSPSPKAPSPTTAPATRRASAAAASSASTPRSRPSRRPRRRPAPAAWTSASTSPTRASPTRPGSPAPTSREPKSPCPKG